MAPRPRPFHIGLVALIVIGGLLPLILYGMLWPSGTGSATAAALPSRVSPAYEQWATVLTAFGVKPVYMLLTVLLIVCLRRQRAADLVALRWGLISFLAGESFCALNYLLYHDGSYLLDHLHNIGMVLTFGFTAWAVMEGLDARVVRFSHPSAPCAWGPLCQRCIKRAPVPCGLRRVFLAVVLPATLILAIPPLCMAFRDQAYTTTIFGTPYAYVHLAVHQFFEFRYLPVVAVVCTLASLLVIILRERHPLPLGKLLAAAAWGALGFAYFRLLLLAAFADNQVWFAFWEEISELLYVIAIAAVLVIFRGSLLTHPNTPDAAQPQQP